MDTVYLDLSSGDGFGWGVLGDNLAKSLETLVPVNRLRADDPVRDLVGPLLQGCGSPYLLPRRRFKSPRRVGYAVFAIDVVAQSEAARAHDDFDVLVTACRWGEEALRRGGFEPVSTIHHGIDHGLFNPDRAVRRRFPGRFVVFSGGKMEFRKGQDVAVQAFSAFASRHPDALLVAAWRNPWRNFESTMAMSPYVPFLRGPDEKFSVAVRRWLAMSGVRPEQVELVTAFRPNADMVTIYGDSDVGLFPNRCEGATNMVMMEYMACGKAVVASDFAGHRDILTDGNSYPLRDWRPKPVYLDGDHKANWCEPDLDEIVERLEEAYADRETLSARGRQAAIDMTRFTWDRAARQFYDVLMPETSKTSETLNRGQIVRIRS